MDTNETNVNEVEETTAPETEAKEEQGIDHLEPCVDLVAELANVAEDIINKNYSAAFSLIDEFSAMGKIKLKTALLQIKDLDSSERSSLKSRLNEKFDLDNDALEIVIESVIDAVEKGAAFGESIVVVVTHIKNYKKA